MVLRSQVLRRLNALKLLSASAEDAGPQVVYGRTSPPRSIFRPTRSKFQPNPTFGLSDLRIIGTLPTLLT